MADLNRAAQVVHEIIRLSGGRISSKARLYKAFYFAHLVYAQKNPDYLTDWPIVKMPHGPGIHDAQAVIGKLIADKSVEERRTSVGPYPATEYRLLTDDVPELPLEAIDAIKAAVDFVKDKSAAELSELTHEYSHSWQQAEDGDELNIYIDLLTDEEYEHQKQEVDAIAADLEKVWA